MIETDRLLVKPYAREDATAFYQNIRANQQYLVDYFTNVVAMAQTMDGVATYFTQKNIDWQTNRGYACGVFTKDDGQLIGHISVRDIEWKVPKAEVAYFIIQSHAGNNYATEALQAFTQWCFAEKQFNRLFMRIGVENIASCKVAQRAGFAAEGLLKKDYRRGGEILTDMLIYGYTGENK
ncbi:Protein N-acetyltransferase, RimJ/RimL family [Filimonas lacunae]|uniref:Protein N-acetyltransferase, RimJ/RimL family n=1 Tax=Filimonas lacunae TaxID=477680 RepID=A0A173M9P4_9BACT|nr:GNAT family N-acetyltransferase [Filimonas lacunae]BAV04231.1 acetyltransferase, GNAT family [Filimonas lacunae]SIT13852.1 Protein N-acetyltransferase, RimJ/RimL family [Filimonas lacunae]